MIPIGDSNPRRLFPAVNYLLITINVLVFLYEVSLGPQLNQTIYVSGVRPNLVWKELIEFQFLPVATSFLEASFLHAGWLHLIGNMLYLWIFGDNVEDKLGHFRYLFFYLLAGFIAMSAHVYLLRDSSIPTIGASGAIAGVLGAYLVLFPRARVLILVPLFFFFPVIEVPAVIVLGFWFIGQLLSGLASVGASSQVAGVAWWAHIGGFTAGMLLVKLFKKRSSNAYYGYRDFYL